MRVEYIKAGQEVYYSTGGLLPKRVVATGKYYNNGGWYYVEIQYGFFKTKKFVSSDNLFEIKELGSE